MKQTLLVSIAACALSTAMAMVQSQPPVTGVPQDQAAKTKTKTTGSANRMTGDNTFINKAAEGGLAEVELGKLATSHASNDKVKQFGQRMVEDHSKANQELAETANRKGVTMPTSLDAKEQATVDRLSKLKGAAFDRAYMQDMVKDHKADISEFRKESTSGFDPDTKAFASKTLPTLEDHLKQAQDTLSQLKK